MTNPDPPLPARWPAWARQMPLLWLSLAFLAGILFASLVSLPLFAWLCVAAGAAILLILALTLSDRRLLKLPPWSIFGLILLAGFAFGAARYQASIPVVDSNHIAWYNDRENELVITGVVTDPPDRRDTFTNLRLEVSRVDTGTESLPVHGLMLARIPPGSDWQYGDVVRLSGHLVTPPVFEDFSYKDYLAHQGILAYMSDADPTHLAFSGGSSLVRRIYHFKDQAVARLYRIFPDPEASLLAGILLGDDNGMPASLQQAFQDTGTAHIIAISGFNIAIIAGLFIALFSRLFGPRKGTLAAALAIAAYTLLVGATPSVLRAALMGGLALLARQLGRRQNGLLSLGAIAAFMALLNPHTLWEASFQLSIAATLGLVLYATPLQDWLTARLSRRLPPDTALKISVPFSNYVLFTLAAQLTTLPIMAWQFGRISIISLLANPFILPAQPALMILAGLALLLSYIYLPLGRLAAWAAWPFAAYTNRAVEFFSRFPHGVINLEDFSFLFVVVFFALLLGLTFARPRLKQALRPALAPSVIIPGLAIAVFMVWSSAFHAPDQRLHLTFLEVGSADAILIQTPSGRAVLVDGGPSATTLAGELGPRLPAYDRGIDWLVVASTREEQVAALPGFLGRFQVENVLWAGNINASRSAEELDRWLAAHETPVTRLSEGMQLDLGSGATLEALDVSPRGAVLLVEWNGFRALLPLGMNLDTLAELDYGSQVGSVTALLLADSGYAPSNPPAWIAALRPSLVVLSVAAGDPDGLPARSVLDSLSGTTLLRTDRDGWIRLSTDGAGLWVEVENK